MAWYAVIENATGRLVSIGQSVADELPAGLVALTLASAPDVNTQTWDAATRAFVPKTRRADRDVVAELMATAGIAALPAATRTAIQTAIANWFAGLGETTLIRRYF